MPTYQEIRAQSPATHSASMEFSLMLSVLLRNPGDAGHVQPWLLNKHFYSPLLNTYLWVSQYSLGISERSTSDYSVSEYLSTLSEYLSTPLLITRFLNILVLSQNIWVLYLSISECSIPEYSSDRFRSTLSLSTPSALSLNTQSLSILSSLF